MNQSFYGYVGGILGSVLGLCGGIIGTYFSIKNTHSSEERSFMVKVAAAFWLAFLLLLALPMALSYLGIIPRWAPFISMTIAACLLGPVIIWGNKRQAEIRQKSLEKEENPAESQPEE